MRDFDDKLKKFESDLDARMKKLDRDMDNRLKEKLGEKPSADKPSAGEPAKKVDLQHYRTNGLKHPETEKQIALHGRPILQEIDKLMEDDFGISRYFKGKSTGDYPTLYCDTLKDFFEPQFSDPDVSPSWREAEIVKLPRQEPGASSLHYYLDIGITFGNMRKHFLGILLYPLNKYFSTISRDPDEMILHLIYGAGTFPKSRAS